MLSVEVLLVFSLLLRQVPAGCHLFRKIGAKSRARGYLLLDVRNMI